MGIVGQVQKSDAGKEHEAFGELAGALTWLDHGKGGQAGWGRHVNGR